MTITVPPPVGDDALGLLDGLIYADAFDCAVTLDELWRYGRVAIDRDVLERRLRDDPQLRQLVAERDGLYCLADRTALIDLRPHRMARARALERRARRVGRVLRLLPFVRGVVLTGSVAANDAPIDADVDLLVVVAPRRLSTAFLLLGPASRLLGRRMFCPNYYVCEGRLAIDPSNLYVARELAQARTLVGDPRSLGEANPWLHAWFPNAQDPAPFDHALPAGARLQRLLEAPFRRRFGDSVERVARRVALARLRAHYSALGLEVPGDVIASFEAGIALRFHRSEVDRTALARYSARCEQVARALRDVPQESAPFSSG